MANQVHFEKLMQGKKVWNKWRRQNPRVHPDFKRVNLSEAVLNGVDLSSSDLRHAVLSGAQLRNARLNGTILTDVLLDAADLSYANLSSAKLNESDLSGAYLVNACLIKADLSNADLSDSDLSKADLRDADLTGCRMIRTNLAYAKITGVNLYGTSRDDWKIAGITCNYVYLDYGGRKRTPTDRRFKHREFEELYKSLPTIEYIFENGFTPLDAVLMDRIVQEIRKCHPEFELKLDSFHSRGTPRAVFTVLHKENAKKALEEVTQSYERQISSLEGKNQQLMDIVSLFVEKGHSIKYITNSGDIVIGDQVKTQDQEGDSFIVKDKGTAQNG